MKPQPELVVVECVQPSVQLKVEVPTPIQIDEEDDFAYLYPDAMDNESNIFNNFYSPS